MWKEGAPYKNRRRAGYKNGKRDIWKDGNLYGNRRKERVINIEERTRELWTLKDADFYRDVIMDKDQRT